MNLLMWLVSWTLASQSIVCAEIDPECFNNCKCCFDEKCYIRGNWSNACSNGCVDGHRGARCYELCQYENCRSCKANITECDSCYDGYFVGKDNNCTSRCPSNCLACSSSTSCTKCKKGFYNKNGSTACNYAECPRNCKCTAGQSVCLSCQSGYFDKNSNCTSLCPLNCLNCTSNVFCNYCKNGFYNGFDTLLDISQNDCSLKCRETCKECQSYNNCSYCINGRYGDICQKECSVGCKGGTCWIESGNCNCSTNFTGDKCTQCVDGTYGLFCNYTCPKYCKDNRCERTTGGCIDGCFPETIVGKTCDKCISGNYGEMCKSRCSMNCKEKTCERYNGTCSDGCEANFLGTWCDTCINGKHGLNCDQICPDKCTDGICEKSSGDCFTCVDNFNGSKCEMCMSGYFGSTCNEICSSQCLKDICNKATGVCVLGCRYNYSGDRCCINSENCMNCSSNTECNQCSLGVFGPNCTEKCSKNCLGSCDILTGECFNCKLDYFGKFCNLNCSENCSLSQDNEKSQCEQITGICFHGCVEGQYGPTCNEPCSGSCLNYTCLQHNGECKHGCVGEQRGPGCRRSSVQTSEPANLTGPFVGGIGALIVVIAVGIVGTLFFRRRRMTKNASDINKDNEKRAPETQRLTAVAANEGHLYANIGEKVQTGLRVDIEPEVVGVENIVIGEQNREDKDDDYCNKTHLSVKVSNLFSYVTKRKAELFEQEFKNLPKPDDLSKVCRIAKTPENIALNRYNGIYPFDHSRVTIPSLPNFFINACYIDGYNRKKAYIASFGPTAKTTDHFNNFWCMVWHEKSDVIVMLTNLHEESGMKCEQYWPDAETEIQYDQVKVKCRSVEEFAEYTVRTFIVSKGKEHRNLTQLHFTAWPDKGVPSEVTSLIEFRQRVKAVPVALDGPIIVHCSAGVGRTGTYIALDILTDQGQAEDSVDVFNCVSKMRGQRVNMVQTAEQYKFLHKALVHSLTFDCEALPAERLQSLVFEADNVFTRMFLTLQKEIDTETDENVVSREENRRRYPDKSRRHSDIPGDRARVRLFLSRKAGDCDFINAVFISSFKSRNFFIAAQTPLPSTVEDFLCMIYQQSASCVVSLESPETSSRSDVGKYLPADNESYRCGDFTVTSSKFENKSQYVLKKLSIENAKKGESKTVYHFQYTKWRSDSTVADSAAEFVHFVKEVQKYIGENDTPHIVVHCLNGYGRSGLFCVVFKLLEKLEAERQVSVVNIVRKIRTQRKLAVSSMEQLIFCCQCISAYLESYNTYSNFAV